MLDKAVKGDKTYEELVNDGAAMERLLNNPDFKVYQRLMSELLAQNVLRMRLVAKEDLPTMQGIFLHHDAVSKLPVRTYELASRMVNSRREEQEVA